MKKKNEIFFRLDINSKRLEKAGLRKIQKNKIMVVVSFLFLISACVYLLGIKIQKFNAPVFSINQYPVSRHIKYGFTLQNKTNRLIKGAEFSVRVPVKQTCTQRCLQTKSSYPGNLTTDELGNQVIRCVFNEFPPFATRVITFSTDLMLSDSPNHGDFINPNMFLKPEKYIESKDPAIVGLAKKLKGSTPEKTVRNIFRWVADNIKHSGYIKKSKGAHYTLLRKKGDCTELMYLFAALCRADNIPVRCVAGYICKGDSIVRPAGYHNWAQFYQGGSWRIADPYNKVFMKNGANYVSMQIMGESNDNSEYGFNRFMVKGKGLKAKMNL